MKKLKLNTVNFAGAEVLTRSQLKNVMGGSVFVTTIGVHECDDWKNASEATCLKCCNTVHDPLHCDAMCTIPT